MSQFAEWPHELAVDLRILRRAGDENDDYRMVLSISMDALTPVSINEIKNLMAAGVTEIAKLPE